MDEDLLRESLTKYVPNVYLQPPSGFKMNYPCVVISKIGFDTRNANNRLYFLEKEYQLLLIERDMYSDIAETIIRDYPKCSLKQMYVVDNLYHTAIKIYY